VNAQEVKAEAKKKNKWARGDFHPFWAGFERRTFRSLTQQVISFVPQRSNALTMLSYGPSPLGLVDTVFSL